MCVSRYTRPSTDDCHRVFCVFFFSSLRFYLPPCLRTVPAQNHFFCYFCGRLCFDSVLGQTLCICMRANEERGWQAVDERNFRLLQRSSSVFVVQWRAPNTMNICTNLIRRPIVCFCQVGRTRWRTIQHFATINKPEKTHTRHTYEKTNDKCWTVEQEMHMTFRISSKKRSERQRNEMKRKNFRRR